MRTRSSSGEEEKDEKALNPGATKTFDYTFALQAAGPHPEFACHLPGHYETGMHLDITVKQ